MNPIFSFLVRPLIALSAVPLAEIFAWVASLIVIVSLVVYFSQVVKGVSTPNPATWLIWLTIGMLNLSTYFHVVGGQISKLAVPLVVNFGILAVTVYSFFYGKFSPLGRFDKAAFVFAFLVGVIWQVSGDAVLANLILQGIYLISFAPTVMGIRRGTLRESPLPWTLAVLSYVTMIFGLCFDWANVNWPAFAHPILNGILGNGFVAYLAFRKNN